MKKHLDLARLAAGFLCHSGKYSSTTRSSKYCTVQDFYLWDTSTVLYPYRCSGRAKYAIPKNPIPIKGRPLSP